MTTVALAAGLAAAAAWWKTARFFVGQARTCVAAADGNPGSINLNEVRTNLRRGPVLVSYGLLAEASVAQAGPGELARPGAGDLRGRVRVQGPAWTRVDRVTRFANGGGRSPEYLEVAPADPKVGADLF